MLYRYNTGQAFVHDKISNTTQRPNMSAETPKHRDLLSSLAELSPSKVEKFAIALGVPKNVIEEFQMNHPHDIYRVKSDALSWWVKNERTSWEAVAKALEATGVDERNLANSIRSRHGLALIQPNETPRMALEKHSPLLEHKCLVAAHVHIPVSIDDLQRSFGVVVSKTMKSLELRVTTEQFALSLLALGAYEPVIKKEQAVLEDHEDEIFNAETIPGIYRIIRPYMSFFNPELLAYIIETHGTQANRDDFKEYMSKLNSFCQGIIVPPMKFSSQDQLLSVEKREKLKIKLNLSDRRLQRFRDVKSAIAKILGVKTVVLYMESVEEGSIEVIFLVPQFVVQHLFPLSDVQVKAISDTLGAFNLTIISDDHTDFPSFEGKKFTPGLLQDQDDTIVVNIVLNCKVTKSSQTKQVHFQSLPTTPLEIKKKIEEYFSIPSCVQTLHYQSMILKDSDELQHTHFRSGDTFSVDYPIEAECQMAQDAIKWLKELFELLKSIEENISFPGEENDLLMSSNFRKIENLILEGEKDNILEALSEALFFPWGDKKKEINCFYFHHEGGLDVLMKVYGILVSKEWGDLGIDKEFHIYLEHRCSNAVGNYTQTFPLRRQIIQLGGLEMCTKTLLRMEIWGDECIPGTFMYSALYGALCALCNLSELPECQVPLAMRTDVIDQILIIACCLEYKVLVPIVSANMMMCLAQSPGAHPYLVRSEVIENLLKIITLWQKLIIEQPIAKKKAFVALKCYTCTALAEIGLGSPDLYSSIPLHLQEQLLCLMSDMLESAPPADVCQYEAKLGTIWGTFLPYMQFLYKPSSIINRDTKEWSEFKCNLHIHCCNVLLYGLENYLGRDVHLEILLKEGLLDYTMCLPAVLPGECQPRARSLVNELGRHRQLQPPSLCTLAKAHIAKTFCGLQPVMEMNSIREFVHKYFPES